MKLFKSLFLISSVISSLISLQVSACEIEELSLLLADKPQYLDFTQEKTIAALSRPLVSSGKIWLSANAELVWQVLTPIKSTMIISKDRFSQLNKDDVLQPELNNATVKDISEVFLNLLSGQLGELEESFSQNLSCDDEDWQLRLEPKTEKFSNMLSFVSLAGSDSLQVISFQEVRGDETTIELSASDSEQQVNLEVYLVQ